MVPIVLAVVVGALVAAAPASAEQACPAANATPASATKHQILRATLCALNFAAWLAFWVWLFGRSKGAWTRTEYAAAQ